LGPTTPTTPASTQSYDASKRTPRSRRHQYRISQRMTLDDWTISKLSGPHAGNTVCMRTGATLRPSLQSPILVISPWCLACCSRFSTPDEPHALFRPRGLCCRCEHWSNWGLRSITPWLGGVGPAPMHRSRPLCASSSDRLLGWSLLLRCWDAGMLSATGVGVFRSPTRCRGPPSLPLHTNPPQRHEQAQTL
jgi:hypothetical protein